jgi:hypothetical protein
MKKRLLLILLIIWTYSLQSQQLNTGSGSSQGNEFRAEWIIGGSLIDNSIFLADPDKNVLLKESQGIDMICVYPTPTKDFLTIAVKDSSEIRLNFKIISSKGNGFLKQGFNINTPYELDVTELAAGYYFIIINEPDNQSYSVYKKFLKL